MRVEMTAAVRDAFVTPDVLIELGLHDPDVMADGSFAFDLLQGEAQELASLLIDRAATKAGMVGRRTKAYEACAAAIRLADEIEARLGY